ncbi:thioredoxin family protein [Paenibacillus lemnae]|uniref:Thioredoxin family protein n=1 Tax=Paenibacillus lemnae TaxID=1330551 RepID=A0A848M6Z4_PAELE|nr:thioredoxin family protein [Paenibacillus lemnae]NMO95960.1 thioredoxin family protein [Paenibacillus lemnae]
MISLSQRQLKERLDWHQHLIAQNRSRPTPVIVFLHTPLCGTCGAARKMLNVAEMMLPEGILLESDVNFLPEIVTRFEVRSVPALLAVTGDPGEPYQLLYRMGSVQDILNFVRSVL